MRGLTVGEASLPKSGNTPREGVTTQQGSLNHEDHVIARRLKVREAGRSCAAHLSRAGEHHGRPIRTFLGGVGGMGLGVAQCGCLAYCS